MLTYTILIESGEDGDGFSAYAPDVPGCAATGATSDETISNMIEALELHLHGMLEDGDPLPERTIQAVDVAVRDPRQVQAA